MTIPVTIPTTRIVERKGRWGTLWEIKPVTGKLLSLILLPFFNSTSYKPQVLGNSLGPVTLSVLLRRERERASS